MLRISAGLAIFLAALGTVGCGTAQAPHPGSGAHPAVPARMKSQGPPPGVSTALPADAGSSSGCQNSAPAGPVARTLVITLVGNGKTYCARVGDTLRVGLQGTGSSQWLRPLVSGAIRPPRASGLGAAAGEVAWHPREAARVHGYGWRMRSGPLQDRHRAGMAIRTGEGVAEERAR
jgi:hypothetical protein